MNSLRALMLTAAMAAFAALGVVARTVFERVSATRPAACAAACRDFLLRIAAAQPSRSEP